MRIFQTTKNPDLSYFLLRCYCRLLGSIFFPLFKYWGETDHSKNSKKKIFVSKYFGFLSWLTVLRTFKKPVRFIVFAKKEDLWIKISKLCGLEVFYCPSVSESDFISLTNDSQRDIFVMFDEVSYEFSCSLVTKASQLKNRILLFFALSGVSKSLSGYIPQAIWLTVLCASPKTMPNEPGIKELSFLERALQRTNPEIEIPSLFFNHKRNIKN